MVIAVGSDHGAFDLKAEVIAHLKGRGIDVIDVGTHTAESCDYPDIAKAGCDKVLSGEADRAILLCGTGIGISMAANKIRGIRAACCGDYFSAKYTRAHNDANALCMGARTIGAGLALELVDIFIDTEFEGGRHKIRVDKVMALEV